MTDRTPVRLTVYIPADLKAAIKATAAWRRESLGEYLWNLHMAYTSWENGEEFSPGKRGSVGR